MKNISVKTRLIIQTILLQIVILTVGATSYIKAESVVNILNNISDTQLPAVRNMTLVDMMHDGLRAIVFKALYYGNTSEKSVKIETSQELAEMSTNMLETIDKINTLNINEDTKLAIQDALPEIKSYIAVSKTITEAALSGNISLATEKMNDFQKAFKSLEAKLEVLGETIEKDADNSRDKGHVIVENSKKIIGLMVLIGFFVGVIASTVIIRSLLKTLGVLTNQLLTTAEKISTASVQISTTSQNLSEATTQQAASLDETAATLEEISAMVTRSAENAGLTASSSVDSQSKANSGKSAVEQMLQSMEEINKSNQELILQTENNNKEISEVIGVIEEIGNKTKVINDIVFQTKLLSFNASVEAARAGEFGKGFSVVAEEVGKLAELSGQRAKEISEMLEAGTEKVQTIIHKSQSQTQELVARGKEKVEIGINVANQCSDILNEIVENVSKVTSLSQEISQATKEQSSGVIEINKAMKQLDIVTKQNSATSEDTASASVSLSNDSVSLKNAVTELIVAINGKD